MTRPPAFQFYPRDWDTDSNVIPMTYEEEGVYFALCRRYWLDGSLPASLDRLRRLLKGRPSLQKMERWWDAIAPCFQVDGEALRHRRLDRERENQIAFREAKARAGAIGGKHKASNAKADGKQNETPLDSASSTSEESAVAKPSSSSSSAICDLRSAPAGEKARATVTPIRSHRSKGAMGSTPADHIGHAKCNDRGVCIPTAKFLSELLGRFSNDTARFNAFYEHVLDTMPDDYVPTGTVFEFWHDMLRRAFQEPMTKPSARDAAMKAEW